MSPALFQLLHLLCAISYTNIENWVYDLEESCDKPFWRHTWNKAQENPQQIQMIYAYTTATDTL